MYIDAIKQGLLECNEKHKLQDLLTNLNIILDDMKVYDMKSYIINGESVKIKDLKMLAKMCEKKIVQIHSSIHDLKND